MWNTHFAWISCTAVQSYCYPVCVHLYFVVTRAHTLLGPVIVLYRWSVHLYCRTKNLFASLASVDSDQWEHHKYNQTDPHWPIKAQTFSHLPLNPDLEHVDHVLSLREWDVVKKLNWEESPGRAWAHSQLWVLPCTTTWRQHGLSRCFIDFFLIFGWNIWTDRRTGKKVKGGFCAWAVNDRNANYFCLMFVWMLAEHMFVSYTGLAYL
jgi:hypothetical protein